MKWLKLTFASALIIATATFTAVRFGGLESRRLREEVDRLEQERRQLIDYAERLSASRRVAQIDVVRQHIDERGKTVNTMLWQEIGRDGRLGRPLAVQAVGELVYFESLVIKFEPRFIGEGDEQRGTSLAMFRRIFGDCQAPESVPELDRSARPPLDESDADGSLHAELWNRFWEMVDDPHLAREFGVRVAQCEAPAVPLHAGQVWEIALDAAGGLNLRRLDGGARDMPISSLSEISRPTP
jgi:hypothetical protein